VSTLSKQATAKTWKPGFPGSAPKGSCPLTPRPEQRSRRRNSRARANARNRTTHRLSRSTLVHVDRGSADGLENRRWFGMNEVTEKRADSLRRASEGEGAGDGRHLRLSVAQSSGSLSRWSQRRSMVIRASALAVSLSVVLARGLSLRRHPRSLRQFGVQR
jgi:hypothetical protein